MDVSLDDTVPAPALLFGESQGRIVLACAPDDVEQVLRIAERYDVPATEIGTVTEGDRPFRVTTPTAHLEVDLQTLSDTFFGTLAGIMDRPVESE